jgi:hypothetical protein
MPNKISSVITKKKRTYLILKTFLKIELNNKKNLTPLIQFFESAAIGNA